MQEGILWSSLVWMFYFRISCDLFVNSKLLSFIALHYPLKKVYWENLHLTYHISKQQKIRKKTKILFHFKPGCESAVIGLTFYILYIIVFSVEQQLTNILATFFHGECLLLIDEATKRSLTSLISTFYPRRLPTYINIFDERI
jgi:hypothetical protein